MNKRWTFAGALIALVLISANAVRSQDAPDDRFKQEFLYRINSVRAVGCDCGKKHYAPAPPLTWNYNLENAAREHATDMYQRSYFSHTSKDGRNIEDRIVLAGYQFKGFRSFAVGENIAFGQTSIAEVSDGWFKSTGHCQNLMNPDFKEIGIAKTGLYWVQDFGGRESFTPQQQQLLKNGGRLIYKRTHEEE